MNMALQTFIILSASSSQIGVVISLSESYTGCCMSCYSTVCTIILVRFKALNLSFVEYMFIGSGYVRDPSSKANLFSETIV